MTRAMGNLSEFSTRKASQKQGGGANGRLVGLSSVRYMDTSLIRKLNPPRALQRISTSIVLGGGGVGIMSEVPLYV